MFREDYRALRKTAQGSASPPGEAVVHPVREDRRPQDPRGEASESTPDREHRVAGGVALAVGATLALAGKPGCGASTALYPDLRTVVPAHLNFVNRQQNEYLRFSNGIANTPVALRPDPPIGTAAFTNAVQEIRSNGSQDRCSPDLPKQVTECYDVLQEKIVSSFEYHATHNHWHTADVALFEVRKGSPTGPLVGTNSLKLGFCLLDLYKLDDNAPTSEKTFWDCYTSYQGISAGWVDQYHQATDGQQVDLTGAVNGTDYYLVSTTNPKNAFLERDLTNNTTWVKFTLGSGSNGNRKVTVTETSPCSGAFCGDRSTNR
ncbi:MAG: lysyl oxidase family protein [Actinomycetota bacterium]|nr:lysyl oxidase family protein [Actinomycetota bacterium]